MTRWKEAVRLAFDSVQQVGVAIVTPDAEDVLEWGAEEGVLFYDCGTPTPQVGCHGSPSESRPWLAVGIEA